MTIQYALSSRSCGIPLSGVAIISEKTDAASPNRTAGSLSAASNDVVRVVKAKPATIANFIFASSVARICLRPLNQCTAGAILGHSMNNYAQPRRQKELWAMNAGGRAGWQAANCMFCQGKVHALPYALLHGGQHLLQWNRGERRGVVGYAVGNN